jgi:hypothetical protein
VARRETRGVEAVRTGNTSGSEPAVFWWKARLRWRCLLAMALLVRAERKTTEDPPGPAPSCGAPSRGAPTGPKPSCGAGRVAVGPVLKRLAAQGVSCRVGARGDKGGGEGPGEGLRVRGAVEVDAPRAEVQRDTSPKTELALWTLTWVLPDGLSGDCCPREEERRSCSLLPGALALRWGRRGTSPKTELAMRKLRESANELNHN